MQRRAVKWGSMRQSDAMVIKQEYRFCYPGVKKTYVENKRHYQK